MGDARYGKFSEKKYALPFGRYVGSAEVRPPANEVLVGRDGQRAYLIDLLISSGRRGAYLITGRRGMGKTSFVKYCIAEYEANVFSRFLRANVGRGFWDRLFVLLFWLAILLGALLTSGLLHLIIDSKTPEGRSTIDWLILIPTGIILLYPCVYAKVVLETVRQAAFDLAEQEPKWHPGRLAACIVVLLGLFCWYLPRLGNTVSSFGIWISILGAMYLGVQATSFESSPAGTESGSTRTRKWIPILVTALSVLFFSAVSIIGIFSYINPLHIFSFQLGLGLTLLGTGLLLRGAHHYLCRAEQLDHGQQATETLWSSLLNAFNSSERWYHSVGSFLCLIGFLLQIYPLLNEADSFSWHRIVVVIGLIIAALPPIAYILFLSYRQSISKAKSGNNSTILVSPRFRPRQDWLLIAKAVVSIIVALQLAHPALSHIPLGVLGPSTSLASQPQLFSTAKHEALWLLTLTLLLAIFHFLEYEWIIRPYVRSREEHAFDESGLAPWDDWDYGCSIAIRRRTYLSLAVLTLPWIIYRTWLPVLPVSVNLGFDRLDHRQVIQAMLVGLRERYHRTLLAWNSGFANLGRFLGLLVLLALVTFLKPIIPPPEPEREVQFWYEALSRIGNARILDLNTDSSHQMLLFYFLPSSSEGTSRTLYFSVLHLLLFLVLLLLGQWLLRQLPILPYKRNIQRIDDLLDSLLSRTKVTSSFHLWGPARWAYNLFSDERRETERDPIDPRTVELAFLQILEDIQKGGFRFPGAARHHLTLPAPEITFIFDELDKLGTRGDPEETRAPTAPEQEGQILYSQRERSIKLRTLLSDLKNIIASAPARFIFVGGRDLHDEWLADHTSRQPLLSSIFSTEVYLPSLLTDQSQPTPAAEETSETTRGVSHTRLHQQIDLYIRHQYERAVSLHRRSVRKRMLPSFGLSIDVIDQETFARNELPEDLPAPFDCENGSDAQPAAGSLPSDFVLFLTHRSMGNPKRLKDLLSSFIRPAGREISQSIRWRQAPCRHVLRFGETEIFRIQLLVTIYRHLALAFEERMVRRDDKFAVSIFFLTDFIFKFHRRAFSWSNLERVDDLAHIHRLPDLREIQEEIVNHFSERFLHRVFNGMYAFRFRSDIAREVEYLSRQSADEMAAFNFTLDESQSLKAEYIAALKGREGNNHDLVAALGELYEFDQDFERSRHQYRVAIDLMDQDLIRRVEPPMDPKVDEKPETILLSILNGKRLEYARLFVPWGVARLRLILQIGMTYEHERDFERAEAEYRSARTLARALVRSYVDAIGRGELTQPDSGKHQPSSQHAHRLHTLKHMNIVFQPIFAQAWGSEKAVGSIDTSTSLVENGLWEIRRALPFVREPEVDAISDMTDGIARSHANFSLTIAQLHNKAGDLYFFKGKQPTLPERILSDLEQSTDRSTEGYLLRAHYHYAVSLHELRRYIHHRVARSKVWLSISGGVRSRRDRAETLRADALPDFLFRATGNSINDMAEATLGRVSLFELFHRISRMDSLEWQKVSDLPDLRKSCLLWLGSDDAETRGSAESQEATSHQEEGLSGLANWFGSWFERESYKDSIEDLIGFAGPDKADTRLFMSLKLCFVGADLFEKGGYPEDAGRELLQVCETVTRYLWWGRMIEYLAQIKENRCQPAWWPHVAGEIMVLKRSRPGKNPGSTIPPLLIPDIFTGNTATKFWRSLINLAIQALSRAGSLFKQSRYQKEEEGKSREIDSYIVGDIIPTEALTLLCSLRLAGQKLLDDSHRRDMDHLLRNWTGSDNPAEDNGPEDDENPARKVLISLLQRHRYPMINRLNGLKILIDHLVLSTHKRSLKAEVRDFKQAVLWAEELLDLNTQFDAPLHFTPLHSGVTCALVWLWTAKRFPWKEKVPAIQRIYRAAQRDLDNSEEMYTMRRAYYEAINGLYYLYDDFNDRQIHFNHAIQMAGAELTAILKHLFDLRDHGEEATAAAEASDGNPRGFKPGRWLADLSRQSGRTL